MSEAPGRLAGGLSLIELISPEEMTQKRRNCYTASFGCGPETRMELRLY